MNEKILPQHFLFRSVYGSFTYFRGVERLIPGYYLKWNMNNVGITLGRSLDAVSEETQYIRDDVRALNLISEAMDAVISDYKAQSEKNGHGVATLLSGGVDSSVVQYYLNAKSSQHSMRSISYVIEVPAFNFEVEYAKQASQLLHTEHTFVNHSPQNYPNLLTRVIDTLVQPPNLETEPSFLAVAEYIRATNWSERFFFTGQGGDTLFGGELCRKLKGLNYLHRLPLAVQLLRSLGAVLAPIAPRPSHMLIKGAEIIASESDPDAYASPLNTNCVYVLDENWEMIRSCFGDQTLREALAFRRNLVAKYTNSHHYLDKVYFIDLSTDLWELAVQRQRLFLTNRLEQVSPFFDEDIIKAALTIHPDIRYIKGFRYKHLLRRLLWRNIKSPVAFKRKGPSTVNDDLVAWMRSGPLRPLVNEITRPSFMRKEDFNRLIQKPDYFVWPLLTMDIFQKRVFK